MAFGEGNINSQGSGFGGGQAQQGSGFGGGQAQQPQAQTSGFASGGGEGEGGEGDYKSKFTPLTVEPGKFTGAAQPSLSLNRPSRPKEEWLQWKSVLGGFVMIRPLPTAGAFNRMQNFGANNGGLKPVVDADVVVIKGPGDYQLWDRQNIAGGGMLIQLNNRFNPAEGGDPHAEPIVGKVVTGKNNAIILEDLDEGVAEQVMAAAREAAAQYGW